jgi:TrmH family RNA methyltransferase
VITSRSNPKLRYVRGLARRAFRAREGRLLLEGPRLVADALASGVEPAFVLVDAAVRPAGELAALLEVLAGRDVAVWTVAPELFAEAADTASPQGVLAVVPATAPTWPVQADLVLVLDGLRDPGNVGGALRSAAAAGADGVLLAPGCADPTQPKVLRAAMGAHFRIAWQGAGWEEIGRRTAGLRPWLAEAGGQRAYDEVDWRQPTAVVVGGEAAGPSAAARDWAQGSVRIPMAGGSESLNAATAAAILLFEAARQRRQGGADP